MHLLGLFCDPLRRLLRVVFGPVGSSFQRGRLQNWKDREDSVAWVPAEVEDGPPSRLELPSDCVAEEQHLDIPNPFAFGGERGGCDKREDARFGRDDDGCYRLHLFERLCRFKLEGV